MKKPQLLQRPKAELLQLARRLGLRAISTLTKSALVERILRARAQRAKARARRAAKSAAEGLAPVAETKRRAVRKRPPPGAARRRRRPSAKTRRRSPPAAGTPEPTPVEAGKFAVGPAAARPSPRGSRPATGPSALPSAYGTGRLFLTARDPGWLHVQWDLTDGQLAAYRGQAADGRLVLRLFERNRPQPVQVIVLTPAARSWYLPVDRPAATYRVQLGYRREDGEFHVITASREVETPASHAGPAARPTFVRLPIDAPLGNVLRYIRAHATDGEQLAYTLERLQAEGHPLPVQVVLDLEGWSDARAARLRQILLGQSKGGASSGEIGALLSGRLGASSSGALARRRRAGGRP